MKRKVLLIFTIILCFMLIPGFVSAKAPKEKKSKPKSNRYVINTFTVAKRSDSSITIKWNVVKKGTGYHVYKSTKRDGKFEKVAYINGNKNVTYTDGNLPENKGYFYKVRVNRSKVYSPVLYVKTMVTAFSDRVTSISAETVKSQTELSWKPVKYATEYRIYRKYSLKDKFTKIKTVKGNVFSCKDYAKSGRHVFYAVRAKNDNSKTFSRYSPLKKFNTITRVYISCGHGRGLDGVWDPGCTYNGYTEAGLMLPITKQMVAAMRRSGVYVYTDADSNNNKNMLACVAEANRKDISAYLSIHCDWHKAPSGTMPLYISKSGMNLAKSLDKYVIKRNKRKGTPFVSRGLTRRPDLYDLWGTNAPACLFETGSIKNDLPILRNSNRYGRSLAEGMCEYLGIKYIN